MLLNKGFHLTYCTNIHPGESWEEIFGGLKFHIPSIKQSVCPKQPFGIGLRLSNKAAVELSDTEKLNAFQQWLHKHNLYVFTINGFPYGEFHYTVVKDQVHQPDWSTNQRLDYTKRLFTILNQLLPKDTEGGVSTSPISYKPWFYDDTTNKENIYYEAARHLAEITAHLLALKKQSGKHMHLDIEPEPDGFLENTQEVIHFFSKWLIPVGGEHLCNIGQLSISEAKEALLNHIQVCYDVCHFSLAYEKPKEVFVSLAHAGIKIGKIQISAALKATIPGHSQVAQRSLIKHELTRFHESTYLHQVVERKPNKALTHYSDLPIALQNFDQKEDCEWRIHFHVPIFVSQFQQLQSTQDDIITVLDILQQKQACQHLEVETYTWEVLPEDLKMDLNESVQRELNWVIDNLENRILCKKQLSSIS
jgi:hypothetical protein